MPFTKAQQRSLLALAGVFTLGLFWYTPPTDEKAALLSGEVPLTVKQIFSTVYKYKMWADPDPLWPYNSGSGSHEAHIVGPYVSAARSFMADTFPQAPDVVDIGCGDFNIGRQIRNMTNRYAACDIVPELIEYNRVAYSSERVDFMTLDIISEEPPAGDIVFIRQVLQHLCNDEISQILPKLYRYKWAVVTEHLPLEDPFIPNLDIKTGGVRIIRASGVELTLPPFNLANLKATILDESLQVDGRLRTTAYQLQK